MGQRLGEVPLTLSKYCNRLRVNHLFTYENMLFDTNSIKMLLEEPLIMVSVQSVLKLKIPTSQG